jgi:SAM-dependent methyltransferase
VTEPDFDFDAVFGDDYLHFYEPLLTPERSVAEAEVAARLLALPEGGRVLDAPCGFGRIANLLAQRGLRVTGLDAGERFLERARADAAALGVEVEYVCGDLRALPFEGAFDGALNWFTSFGYFDDDVNRTVLEGYRRALAPGGRLLVETQHGPSLMTRLLPAHTVRRGQDFLLDETRYEALSGRLLTERTSVRDGRARSYPFFVRLFSYPELRDWLLQAGFARVEGYGDGGAELVAESRRMILVAERGA